LAHLRRELNKCNWSKQLKELFIIALELKRQLLPVEYCEYEKVKNLESRLDLLFKTDLADKNKKEQSFKKRLNKNRNAIFTFLHHPKVPLGNNT